MEKAQATYRHVAKMLASALPIKDDEFGSKVEEYLEIIKRLNRQSKIALRSAYIFSRKAPRQERQDLFQELCLAVLENNVDNERLGYAIARCDWIDFWRKYKTREHFFSGNLNETVLDSDQQEVELAELIVGEVGFERTIDDRLDAKAIWDQLPANIKPIIQRRLEGRPLPDKDRKQLSRFVRKQPLLVTR